MSSKPCWFQSVAFPDLNSLSVAELEQLNSSADCLDEFVDSLPVMKEIDRTMEEWITRNEEVASMSHTIDLLCVTTVQVFIKKLVFFPELKYIGKLS